MLHQGVERSCGVRGLGHSLGDRGEEAWDVEQSKGGLGGRIKTLTFIRIKTLTFFCSIGTSPLPCVMTFISVS